MSASKFREFLGNRSPPVVPPNPTSGPDRSTAYGGDVQLELVEQARGGDHDAFAVLVRAATPRLYGAAKLILRDPDRAQDAVQEALVLAWRHVRALRDPGAWDAWLYRLTVRACTRLAQANRRRDLVELAAVPDREPAIANDFPAYLAERDRLGRELSLLPIDQRTVMVLHFYLDLPLTSVADILGVPVGTAKSRLNRGLATLRSAMATEPTELHVVQERPA
jgi:RNA polymerase sigma-70 factor (ECF subfamily)